MGNADAPNEILDSWKEIATFLRRGVRTVQRWEATEGLPVRRQNHLKKGTVYALRSELERWRKNGRQRVEAPANPLVGINYSKLDSELLHKLCIVARQHASLTRIRAARSDSGMERTRRLHQEMREQIQMLNSLVIEAHPKSPPPGFTF